MKKILMICLLLLLCGCSYEPRKEADPDERYLVMIDMLKEYDNFVSSSDYYSISAELSKIDQGYRYYITLEDPRIAMYEMEMIAIEDGVDYTKKMAANVGLFEEKAYHMIPNQIDVEKGYVGGLIISGISEKPETTLYVLIAWKSKDLNIAHYEHLKLDVAYQG